MVEPPKIELPHNENKLFDEDEYQATPMIPDLSIEPEEGKDTSLTGVWDMPLSPFSNSQHFTQMAGASNNGFITKTWTSWNS